MSDSDATAVPIYLDYNASTPLSDAVVAEMLPFLSSRAHFGNPSSSHPYGVEQRKAIELARKRVATALSVNGGPDEIVFTSGGTESNNYAVRGAARLARTKYLSGAGGHIVTSVVEHPAIMEVCRVLEKHEGFAVSWVPVDSTGRVATRDVLAAVRPDTVLITIMHANNEVGTINPIAEICAAVRELNAHRAVPILVHTDAAQTVGKIPVNVQELGVDLLSVCSHKFYGPKGIGALYIRRGVELEKQLFGANHERNLRPGTENVLEIVGVGKAAEEAHAHLEHNMAHMREMREYLHQVLLKEFPEPLMRLNGHETERLPNTLNVSFFGIEGSSVLDAMTSSVAASCGAACHSGDESVSYVLLAMKVPEEYRRGALRLSVGLPTTKDEIDRAAAIIVKTVRQLMPQRGSDAMPVSAGDLSSIRLTTTTHGLGCGCKLRPQLLERVLCGLPKPTDPNVLVGTSTADDAGVYKLSDDVALVQTVDFFTPVVDDPYWFGAIAAANSISDVYAMGGRPLTALNIVGFPSTRLPLEVLQQMLLGAAEKAAEAGVSILGGHSIEDLELKFGMSVTGIVHPDKVWINAGVRPGDYLILTKPLGVGMLSTGLKRGLIGKESAERAMRAMATLNKYAADCVLDSKRCFTVHSCTDVTGFGLLGHLREMILGSRDVQGTPTLTADIYAGAVPLLPDAEDLAIGNTAVPGGTRDNLSHVSRTVQFESTIPQHMRLLLADATTSGGLLFSIGGQEHEVLALLADLKAVTNDVAALVGRTRLHTATADATAAAAASPPPAIHVWTSAHAPTA